MSRDAPWHKMYSRDWLDGTRDLQPALRGLLIDLICLMSERDGPVPDDDGWIAHQLHISKRAWRAARETLVGAGKLHIVPDGLINRRAAVEIENRANRRRINAENGAKNQPKGHENSKSANNLNGNEKRAGERNGRYARARQSESSYEDISVSGSSDCAVDEGDGCPATIPPMWRAADLQWLCDAIPGDRLHGHEGLLQWLWRLERVHGPTAIDAALRRVRRPVEKGDVLHVRRYVEQTLENRRLHA